MKNHILFFTIFNSLIFLFSAHFTYSQPELWEVYTVSDQPYVNVVVDKYESDSLHLMYMDQSIVLHQDSVKYLVQKGKGNSALGALIGAVLGGLAFNLSSSSSGAFFSEFSKGTSTILGVFLGALIGGIVGISSGTDTEYNFEEFNTEKRRIVLTRLFPHH